VLTRDDLIDLLVAGLAKAGPAAAASVPAPAPGRAAGAKTLPALSGRPFLSEYEIKKRLTPGSNRLTIPGRSIISPAAVDWLTLRGIEIVRE
jgi:hypothetical protein